MQKKKQTKTRNKKLGIDPTLKPRVVKTKSTLTEEQQNENPLGRMKMTMKDAENRGYKLNVQNHGDIKLPEGFKTADSLTEVDDLKFENGKLREMLISWLDRQVIDGVAYQILADPLNRVVQIMREP